MKIEVSIGEIVDKLTILDIKMTKILELEKLKNISKEYGYLKDVVEDDLGISCDSDDYKQLLSVNQELWDIEDKIRDKERGRMFDEEFIELARSVYITNDKRAEIKKEFNLKYGSSFVEEKSYSPY
jgi:hypothetical protein